MNRLDRFKKGTLRSWLLSFQVWQLCFVTFHVVFLETHLRNETHLSSKTIGAFLFLEELEESVASSLLKPLLGAFGFLQTFES